MKHLEYAKQSYFKHMKDSFFYSFSSLKASLYFFIHGIYPDIFIINGSRQISELHKIINIKLKKNK